MDFIKSYDPCRQDDLRSPAAKMNFPGDSNVKQNMTGITEMKRYNLTDLGNAERMVDRYGENIRYCHQWGKWILWDGKRWSVDDAGGISRLAKTVIRTIHNEASCEKNEKVRTRIGNHAVSSESERNIRAMIKLAQNENGVPVTPGMLDRDIWALNVENGTIDLKTGKLNPHDRNDLITRISPVIFDPESKCPLWMSFMERIMEGDKDKIKFLQRVIGYSLTGNISEQCIFILYGTGRNGKSAFLNIIRSLLGEFARHTPAETLLVKKLEGIPNDIARLKSVRYLTTIVSNDGKRIAGSLVKQMTGDYPVVARFPRREYFEYIPQFKIFLTTDHLPEITGSDPEMWKHIHLIPFTLTTFEEEIDPHLLDNLNSELSGILNWAIEGCMEWQRTGLNVPESVKSATSSCHADMDILTRFITNSCILDDSARTRARDLYKTYREWCEENGGCAISEKSFSMGMLDHGFVKKKSSVIYWHGIMPYRNHELKNSASYLLKIQGVKEIFCDEDNTSSHHGHGTKPILNSENEELFFIPVKYDQNNNKDSRIAAIEWLLENKYKYILEMPPAEWSVRLLKKISNDSDACEGIPNNSKLLKDIRIVLNKSAYQSLYKNLIR